MVDRKKHDTVQDLLAIALDDEQLPEGAEKRCIERVAIETGPFRVVKRPAHLRKRAADGKPGEASAEQGEREKS